MPVAFLSIPVVLAAIAIFITWVVLEIRGRSYWRLLLGLLSLGAVALMAWSYQVTFRDYALSFHYQAIHFADELMTKGEAEYVQESFRTYLDGVTTSFWPNYAQAMALRTNLQNRVVELREGSETLDIEALRSEVWTKLGQVSTEASEHLLLFSPLVGHSNVYEAMTGLELNPQELMGDLAAIADFQEVQRKRYPQVLAEKQRLLHLENTRFKESYLKFTDEEFSALNWGVRLSAEDLDQIIELVESEEAWGDRTSDRNIISIQAADLNRAEVDTGFMMGPLAGWGKSLELERDDSEWKLVQVSDWVS